MQRMTGLLSCARIPAVCALVMLVFALSAAACGQNVLQTVRVRPTPRPGYLAELRTDATLQAPVTPSETATAAPVPSATETLAPSLAPAPSPTPEATPEPQPETADSDAAAAPATDAESPAEPVADAPSSEAAAEPPPAAPRPAPPVRIAIPRIGVSARVVPVGEAADGSMDAPNNPFDVGWWAPGFRPGEDGSAAMGGHVDYAGYGAAVFWNLRLLRPGDTIAVTDDAGVVTTFVVTDVVTYAYNDTSVIDRVFRAVGDKELNLITCTGTFNSRTHNYDKRIVVYSQAS